MNWIIILSVVIIISVIALIISNKLGRNGIGFKQDWTIEVDSISLTTLSLSVVTMITILILGICTNIHPEHKFEKDMMEYKILQEQVDRGIYNSTTLTEDIVEYNKKVYNAKKYHDSKWSGFLYYNGSERLPYVTINEVKEND